MLFFRMCLLVSIVYWKADIHTWYVMNGLFINEDTSFMARDHQAASSNFLSFAHMNWR